MVSIFQKTLERVLAEQTGQIEFSESQQGGMLHIHATENGETVGEAIIYPDISLAKGRISPTEKVWRLQSIGATEMMQDPDRTHSRGIGRELWRRIFAHVGDDWLANSQLGYDDDRRAVVSIEKLAKRGWIELHWITGQKGANFIAKLTADGKAWVDAGPAGPPKEYDTYISGMLIQPDYLKGTGFSLPRVGTVDELLAVSARKDPLFVPTRGILDGHEFRITEPYLTQLFDILGDSYQRTGIFNYRISDKDAYYREKIVPLLRVALAAAIQERSTPA